MRSWNPGLRETTFVVILTFVAVPYVHTYHSQEIMEEPAISNAKQYQQHGRGGGGGGGSDHKMEIDTVRLQVVPNSAYGGLQDLPSPSGRLSDRIERLRQRCTEALGRDAFRDAYTFLKQHEEVGEILLLELLYKSVNRIGVIASIVNTYSSR